MRAFQKNGFRSLTYFFKACFLAGVKALHIRKCARYASIGLMVSLSACSSMTPTQKNTAIGSAAGGALGYIVTGGPLGTIGGAVVGGVVGAKH